MLEERFSADIAASPFRGFVRLLLPHLLTTLRTQWTARDLETIGLTREIELFPYERFKWGSVTRAVGREMEREVTEWLMAWHKVCSFFLTFLTLTSAMRLLTYRPTRPTIPFPCPHTSPPARAAKSSSPSTSPKCRSCTRPNSSCSQIQTKVQPRTGLSAP